MRNLIYNHVYNEINTTYSDFETISNNLSIIEKDLLSLQLISVDINFSKKFIDEIMKLHEAIEQENEEMVIKLFGNIIEMADNYINIDPELADELGEVFTPTAKINEQLDLFKDDFSNEKLRWLDLANGIGNYPICLIQRLIVGLRKFKPSVKERIKYILEEMIYVCELQEKNMFLWMCLVDLKRKYDLKFFRGSFLSDEFKTHVKNEWKLDSFDRIMGNPPYQKKDGGNAASATPLYNLFMERALEFSNKNTRISLLTPSRWFVTGKGLAKYRKNMLKSGKLEVINHYDDAASYFNKTSVELEIKGGVSYFLYNLGYKGNCIFNDVEVDLSKDEILVLPKNYSLLDKIREHKSLANICVTSNYYGVDYREGRGARTKDTKLTDDYIKCFVSQPKGFEKWIDKKYVAGKDISHYRVATPRAATKGGEGLGNIFMVSPNQCHTDTYLSFPVASEDESKSLITYLKTDFSNYLLSLRKLTQDIKPDTFRWVPVVPFDRDWTDEKLFDYFDLTDEEVSLIKCFEPVEIEE